MSYWILTASDIPVSITTAQHMTYIDTCTNARKKSFKVYDEAIKERFHEKYTEEAFASPNSTKLTMEMWAKLAEDDKDFQSEFSKVFDNPGVKEADEEFTPNLYDNYVNMELTLYQGGERPEFARVKKILKDTNGRQIGVANDNPILDSRMYEVEYRDGYVATMEANVIAENLFTQVDQEGNIFLLIESIIDTRTSNTKTLQQYAFVITKSGTKQRKI